ncbi:MAG: hypothetical protein ACRD2D_01300, partial [Terriglobales bacterium]
MLRDPMHPQLRRRTWPRYAIGFVILLVLVAGWTWAWDYSADKAQAAVEGWRAREAKAGRIYA